MEIRQFQYFTAVVREGSFGRAARALHISQPALSKQVHALEMELGVELLIRGTDGVRPTEAGRRLTEMSDSLLDYLASIRDAVRAAPAQIVGNVSVGVSPSLLPVLADSLRQVFAAAHPAVRLQIIEASPMFLMDWIDLGRLDVGLFSRWPPFDENDRLLYTDIGGDEVMLVMSPALAPDDVSTPATAESLRAAPLALTPGYRNLVRRLFVDAVPEDLGVEIDSIHMIHSLVLRGQYASVLPRAFVADDIDAGNIVARKFSPRLHRQVAAVTRAGRRPSAAVAAVIDVVSARLREFAPEG